MAAFMQSRCHPRIEFTVASQHLAENVYHAFVRFGMVAKFYKTKNAWRVEITSLKV